MEDLKLQYIVAAGAFLMVLVHVIWGKSIERYAVKRGVLDPAKVVKFGAFLLLICGAICLTPDHAQYGFWGVAGYCVATAVIIHKFWDEPEPEQQAQEVLHFAKNLLLAGILFVSSYYI